MRDIINKFILLFFILSINSYGVNAQSREAVFTNNDFDSVIVLKKNEGEKGAYYKVCWQGLDSCEDSEFNFMNERAIEGIDQGEYYRVEHTESVAITASVWPAIFAVIGVGIYADTLVPGLAGALSGLGAGVLTYVGCIAATVGTLTYTGIKRTELKKSYFGKLENSESSCRGGSIIEVESGKEFGTLLDIFDRAERLPGKTYF